MGSRRCPGSPAPAAAEAAPPAGLAPRRGHGPGLGRSTFVPRRSWPSSSAAPPQPRCLPCSWAPGRRSRRRRPSSRAPIALVLCVPSGVSSEAGGSGDLPRRNPPVGGKACFQPSPPPDHNTSRHSSPHFHRLPHNLKQPPRTTLYNYHDEKLKSVRGYIPANPHLKITSRPSPYPKPLQTIR